MAGASSPPAFAPKVKVLGVEAFEQPFRLRMPFRFGVITVTEGLQAFLRVHLRLDDGREGFGYAAETLAAKWFDKSADLSDAQNQDQLRKSIEIAAEAYREAPPSTAFDLFADNYRHQLRAGRELGLPPLVASYGNALARPRRARRGLPPASASASGRRCAATSPGMTAHPVIADLGAFDFNGFLASLAPVASIEARHTVGLLDPITAGDQAPGQRASTTACRKRSRRWSPPTASAASSSR